MVLGMMGKVAIHFLLIIFATQCLSQDLETGCLKLAVVKFLGVHIFKGDHNILTFQPYTCINSSK